MKFIDYNSPEKAIINTAFNSLSYMDIWISSIVEGYIYEKVEDPKGVSSVDKYGYREEYMLRYGKKEGEYKEWYSGEYWKSNGKLSTQVHYKEGKREGEYKGWYPNGQLCRLCYYKEGMLDGECKVWCSGVDRKLSSLTCYKEGKYHGECKDWWDNGNLRFQKYYK